MANNDTQKPHKNIRGAEYYANCINEQKESSALSRIREFIQWAIKEGKCGSIYDFEVQCGLSRRYISNSAANGRGSVGSDILGRIVRQFPMLNLDWVCTGEGRMLKDADPDNMDYKEVYLAAMKQIEALNKIISKS